MLLCCGDLVGVFDRLLIHCEYADGSPYRQWGLRWIGMEWGECGNDGMRGSVE